jgi:uncharacterized Ntn-hydrolase superfamily protein
VTYSIVARDPQTGELGCAVQSHFFAVGTVVPWAEPGVGVVATQAQARTEYGPQGLERLRRGEAPVDALAAMLATDEDADVRQVGIVDAHGRVATHTGDRCIAYAGHRQGLSVSMQANMMLRDSVPDAMLEAFESTGGDLAGRMLAALDAAEAEGGDIRGRQSAAMLVVPAEPSREPRADRLVDLRVDDHPEPLSELRRLLRYRRAYDAIDRAEAAGLRGDTAAATAEYGQARSQLRDNVEPAFWFGLGAAMSGDLDAARELLAEPFAAGDGWRELLRRLPAAGMFPDDPGLIEQLLE